MGGTALFGNDLDDIRFLRMWLNDGMGEAGRVLKPETDAYAGARPSRQPARPARETVSPSETNDAEFFPGVAKGWGLTFMMNKTRRRLAVRPGLCWAGLGNLYYSVDRQERPAGAFAAQVFPFMDPAAVEAFLAFETAVYDALRRRAREGARDLTGASRETYHRPGRWPPPLIERPLRGACMVTKAPAPKVTIVGGGIAGLTAALRLAERGFAVTVFEQYPLAVGILSAVKRRGVFHEVYPHMFGQWYHNFWRLVDDVGLSREGDFERRDQFGVLRPASSRITRS